MKEEDNILKKVGKEMFSVFLTDTLRILLQR